MKRLLIPSSALLWGLQLAFLSPALALVLVTLYDATTAEVGWVLSIYNASGFLAALALPAYADRKGDYLRPMLVCGVLTVALAGALALATSLPIAAIALVVLGGPAGVGSSLLYAHLRHSGAKPSDIVNTRAIVSVAWVAGPPLATVIIGVFGNRAILLAVGAVAVLNVATTAALITRHRATTADAGDQPAAQTPAQDATPMPRLGVVLIMTAFIALQATNATAMTIMTVYVIETLRLEVIWAGIALGVAAGLEVPALLFIGRLTGRFSSLGLIATGCLAGIAYYVGLAFVSGPVLLIGLQVLNACFFGAVAGVGLTLFQQVIPRPGLASGLYMNTRRLGAIVSGPVIALGSLTILGQRGIFVGCAILTVLGLILIGAAGRIGRRPAAGRPPEEHPSEVEPTTR
jgi:MFS transporter, SET family, sugar efflux transporter